MSDFAKLHAAIFESAKRNLKRDGFLQSVGILCTEKTHAVDTVSFQWKTDEEKAQNLAAFGAMVYLKKADYAYAVLDASIGTMEDFEKGVAPIEKPLDDRREIIIVIGFEIHPTITHAARVVEYRRSGSDMKTITFRETPPMKGGKNEFNGNTVHWFKEGYAIAGSNAMRMETDTLVCEHGRRAGQPCPHCPQSEGTNAPPA